MTRQIVYSITAVISVSLWAVGTKVTGAEPAATFDESAWSQESNGLQARLSMRFSHVINGTGIVVTYLELKNVSDLGSHMLVSLPRQGMTFTMTDSDGQEVPMIVGPLSVRNFGPPELVLPHDSSIRFRIGPQGWGIPADQAALVDLGPSFGWVLPRDGKAYDLQATLEIPKTKENPSERGSYWHGQIELPRVRIPTEPEPVDPATLGPLIDELGAKMLAKDSRKSEAAVRRLSLIDDPRVIPWYIKAMKTDRYSLKLSAMDRLSRLEGDDAFEGLKIGIATQGVDIGNTTKPALAASSAENVRHSAAVGLARSPHPQAKALLLSMHDDPAKAVRITVTQTAARMETPESLALLKHLTKDSDEAVRNEAARLLKLREDETEH